MPPETPDRIEPCRLESIPPELGDLLAEIAVASTTLGSRLHPRSAESLAGLVRVMNCYYSNLIEGRETRPRDIERALTTDFSHDPAQRDLQQEATAHIRVQAEIDHRHACGTLAEPTDGEFIRWMHGEFYRDAPDSMLTIEHPGGPYRMEPGVYRYDPRHDVVVGRQPPSSTAVLRFMEYFSDHFRLEKLGRSQRIIAIAVAHHRFNYIHPFPNGNGRVSRLLSHAMARVPMQLV